MPQIEFDPLKSLANLIKHGRTLASAARLWDDPRHIFQRARFTHESRFKIIGQIEGKTWTCIFALRQGRIRPISLRRARQKETRAYQRR